MKNEKKILFVLLLILLLCGCLFLSKGSYSDTASSDVVTFDYNLDVDYDNKVIYNLTSGITVTELMNNIKLNESASLSAIINNSSGIKKKNVDMISSGDVLLITDENSNLLEYNLSVIGDADGTGVIDLVDLIQLRKHIVGWKNPETGNIERKSGVYLNSIDLNSDGAIDLIDLIRMRKMLVGKAEVTSIKINVSESTMTVGDTLQIEYSLSPNNSTNKKVTWTSSDTSVATVSDGLVTAIKSGTATISVKTSNGLIKTCKITVKAESEVTSIEINVSESTMTVGDTLQIEYSLSPNNSTDKKVTWTSSDTSVATVSDGLVTAIKPGTATISVKTSNGLIKTCKITVKAKIVSNVTIEASIDKLRDPFVLLDNGVYYIYGTGWVAYKNDSGSLDGTWKSLGVVVEKNSSMSADFWAPEVYKYKGSYYMFATYKSSVTNHRGTSVFKSDSPEGPFVEISDGHVTPSEWDSIDGTLYIDKNGEPWMFFVHEWTSTSDGYGRMAVAKMSNDLSSLITEPIELFKSSDPTWTNYIVTDGPWIYETSDGQLLMLWSNLDSSSKYAVGIARSSDGMVDGKWTQDSTLLYSKSISGKYDGGHGMIFNDINGQMYLCIHSPNTATTDRKEKPVFIPIQEINGTLEIVK